MKKYSVFILVFIVLLLSIGLTGCNKKAKDNAYFKNFVSHGQFSTATEMLSFDDGETKVLSYDVENDVFITYRPVINNYTEEGFSYLYGLVSLKDGVYTTPIYTGVIAINGDYAIVTKPAFVDATDSVVSTIGVVKYRGENKGDLSSFLTAYNEAFSQFYFAGNYIACPGNKEYPFSSAPYTTFYDYSTGRLLEVFKIRCNFTYDISVFDDYVVATKEDYAFFYDVKDIQKDGFLTYDERATYIAYPEDTEKEYTDNVQVDIYYLGNGWFSRTGRMKSEEEFVGYNIIYNDIDLATGEGTSYYANIRCDLYNAKSRSVTDREGLLVENVANKYYSDYYAQFSAYFNNLAPFDETTGDYDYNLPYMDVSAMVNDGYSIVYYYYFPYIDEGSYESEITFCIMDSGANIISLQDMLMPTVFVDNVGTECSDLLYSEYYGSVHYFDFSLTKHEQLSVFSGQKTYATFIYNGKGTVTKEIDLVNVAERYGIVSPEGKILVPFEYNELAPFYGEYTMGSKSAGGKAWYRISASGEVTQVYDVVNVRQGVYVYQQFGKLGLKNFAGDVILDAVYEKLDVYHTFLTGGNFQSNYVIAVKDGVTKIYNLG